MTVAYAQTANSELEDGERRHQQDLRAVAMLEIEVQAIGEAIAKVEDVPAAGLSGTFADMAEAPDQLDVVAFMRRFPAGGASL